MALSPVANRFEDDRLFFNGRVLEEQFHQEPVDLGFGERVCPFRLEGIFGRDDEERPLERERLPVNGHLPLLHRFEECGLDLGRRAVDLVGEDELVEHRAFHDRKRPVLLVVHPGADDIGGKEIGGELEPRVRAPDAGGDGPCEQGLSYPRDTFEEDVPPREE